MSTRKRTSTTFLLLVLVANYLALPEALAQSKRCDGILIPDVTIRHNEFKWAQTMINIFHSHHIDTYDDYKNFMGDATIPIEGVPWSFGTNITDKNFKEVRDDLFKYNSLDEQRRSKINETLKSLSNAAIDAWDRCQNQLGFRVWVLQGPDPKTFTLAATYRGLSVVHLRNVSFSQPVSTDVGGVFMDTKLKTITSYEWGDGARYQTFTRTTNNAIDIDVNPKEDRVGDGLHIQLPAIVSSTPLVKIEIADGDLNANAEVIGYGVRPADNPSYHKSLHPLSVFVKEIGPTLDFDAAFAHTQASATMLINAGNNYKWSLDIQNVCGGTSIGDGGGGEGYVTPYYRTTVALPPLSSKLSTYTVVLSGNSHVDLAGQSGEGGTVNVSFSVNGQNKNLIFKVDKGFSSDTLIIPDIQPGWYSLVLQMPKVGGGSAGANIVTQPELVHKRIMYQTNLSVEGLTNTKYKPARP